MSKFPPFSVEPEILAVLSYIQVLLPDGGNKLSIAVE